MIPLPRAWLLTSALLIGCATGQVAALLATVAVHAKVRPDLVVGLVVGVPIAIGMLVILLSRRSWATALGAFILAIAPGWLGVLLVIQVASGG